MREGKEIPSKKNVWSNFLEWCAGHVDILKSKVGEERIIAKNAPSSTKEYENLSSVEASSVKVNND